MMQKLTQQDFEVLLSDFTVKPRLKRELRFHPEQILDWEKREFVTVMNRSRSEGVIIAQLEELFVVSFRLTRRIAARTGRQEPIICDICATWQRGSHSAVISFIKDRRSISFLCCEDLNCCLHVRDQTSQARLSRMHLRESLSLEGRAARLQRRLKKILQEVK